MKKKNIMLLIGYLNNGGAEKSIVKLANELSKDHNVYFVVAHSSNPDYNPNCQIIEIPELRKKVGKIIAIYKIRKLKKQLNIDVSISYTTVFNFVNVATKYKEKNIISVRNYLSIKEKEKLYKLLHIYSIKKTDLIVCCSKAVKYDQITNYHAKEKKIVVIENFCDEKQINILAKENVNFNNYIVTIARLEKHKGLTELIKAFKIVNQNKSDLKLLIFGRGKEQANLQKLINQLNLNDVVIFMGFTNNPYKYLNKAKCFILTSYYEGFSNSIIEAMTCACPIIAIDSPGGNREILTNCYYGQDKKNTLSYGILLNNHDIDNISKAIIDITGNKYNYYSKLSLIRSKQYTKKKIMRKWYDIL